MLIVSGIFWVDLIRNNIIKSNNFQNEFIESLQRTLDDKVSKYLKGLQIEFSEKNNLALNIANIESVEDYENVIDSLKSIIGIEDIKINAFVKNTLISDIYFFGNNERFINAIDDKSDFKLTNISDSKKDIFVEYKKWVDTLYLYLTFYQSSELVLFTQFWWTYTMINI